MIIVFEVCHLLYYCLFIRILSKGNFTFNLYLQVDIQSALYSCCIAPSLSNSQICLVKKFSMKLISFRDNHADAYIKDIISRKHVQVMHLFM